jgi:serine/threonine-protein kinase
MFSPDGRWVAYETDETGRYEVYVTPFPGPGPRLQISTRGGVWPVWSKTRAELLFSTPEAIVSVPYRIDKGTFIAGKAEVWAEIAAVQRGGLHQRSIDLHPDGTRFALDVPGVGRERDRASNQVTLIFNFFELLSRRIPS